jgi:hypothetical protein
LEIVREIVLEIVDRADVAGWRKWRKGFRLPVVGRQFLLVSDLLVWLL